MAKDGNDKKPAVDARDENLDVLYVSEPGEKITVPASINPAVAAVVEAWFRQHFCNPAFYQTGIYNLLHGAKEDLLERLKGV